MDNAAMIEKKAHVILVCCAVLCVIAGVAVADSLTVVPGINFTAVSGEVEVSVSITCEVLTFLTIENTIDDSYVEYVEGSAEYNTSRVTTSPLPGYSPFNLSGTTLTFQAHNNGDACVAAGTDWVYRFRVRGVGSGNTRLAPNVTQAKAGSVDPSPIETGADRITVYDVTGLPDDPSNDTDATVTVVGQNTYVTQYKYDIDSQGWSGVRDADVDISLTGLGENEQHTLSIRVGDADGNWQSAGDPFRLHVDDRSCGA